MQTRNYDTLAWIAITAGLLFGAYFAVGELSIGGLYTSNNGMVWTLPLVTYIFLALMSTGISIILGYSTIRNNEEIIKQSRYLLILSISLLIGGFVALGTELGSPFHLFWLIFSPNFTSPIWFMGTLYAVELVLLAIKLFRDIQGKHGNIDNLLTWAAVLVAVSAALMLGAVFGTVSGREIYSGVHASVLTLSVALVSGAAAIVLLQSGTAHLLRFTYILRGLSALLAIFLLLQWGYDLHNNNSELQGWVCGWMILLFVITSIFGDRMPFIAAFIAAIASLWVLLAFVISGQASTLGPMSSWFGATQTYQPNMAEIGIFVLGIAVAAAVFKLGRLIWLNSSKHAEG